MFAADKGRPQKEHRKNTANQKTKKPQNPKNPKTPNLNPRTKTKKDKDKDKDKDPTSNAERRTPKVRSPKPKRGASLELLTPSSFVQSHPMTGLAIAVS
jgi:hypothetical protein